MAIFQSSVLKKYLKQQDDTVIAKAYKKYTKSSLKEEFEWIQYFNEQKQKASEIISQIDKTDREIDGMVYKLCGLTDKEIGIGESTKRN